MELICRGEVEYVAERPCCEIPSGVTVPESSHPQVLNLLFDRFDECDIYESSEPLT